MRATIISLIIGVLCTRRTLFDTIKQIKTLEQSTYKLGNSIIFIHFKMNKKLSPKDVYDQTTTTLELIDLVLY